MIKSDRRRAHPSRGGEICQTLAHRVEGLPSSSSDDRGPEKDEALPTMCGWGFFIFNFISYIFFCDDRQEKRRTVDNFLTQFV